MSDPAAVICGAELVGRPARPVVRRLREAGLVARIEWSPAGGVPAGTVIAVRPEGDVPRGAVITLTVAALEPD
ncbi:PASTA domain-containing protein [Trebonia sp.]|uniref:PASTA domain-containing protein n=1 Tax=Trebonia sp. TaxID=2767075 RepID=UPI002624A347|nr:PASTA domain-containing protein [Trebonia sp.]